MWSIIKNYILVIYLTSRILFPFDQAIMFSKQEIKYIKCSNVPETHQQH